MRSDSAPPAPVELDRFGGYLASGPSRTQALLDLERLADCLSYYAYRHAYRTGDGDAGARAAIALSDVLGWGEESP